MNLSWLNRARIARSLVAVLAFTSLQIITGTGSFDHSHAYTRSTPASGNAYGGTGGSPNGAAQDCSSGAIVAIGATKSGNNLNSFMYVCKSINDDATLSATEATTNVFYSPSESDRCATGQIGVGVRVIASNGGSLVGGVGLICGNLMSQGNQDVRSIMPNASSPGTVYTYTCGAGQLLTGFYLRTGALVDQITPKCSTFSGFAFGAVGAPTASVTGNTASVSFATVTGSIADTALTYTVSAVPNTGSTITVTGSSSPISVPGLVLRSNYTITVTASNSYGSSPSTSSTSASVALPGGDTDTALSLNGSNQYAEVTDSAGTPFDLTGSLTLEAWIYPTSDCASDQAIISKLDSYMIYCGTNGVFKWVLDSDGAAWWGVDTTVKIRKNSWQHVAFTKSASSGTASLYVDGYLAASIATGVTTMQANDGKVSIGRFANSNYFKGLIDDARIYNNERTQSQIRSDMQSYANLTDANLVAYYDFNEGTGSTIYNRKSGATAVTDLTMYGSPTWNSESITATTTSGPYTVQTFLRSYLTSTGGWKVPTNVSRATVIVVGGGGGAGAGTAQNAGPAGAGGGGGVTYVPVGTLTPGTPLTVTVGQGGRGDTQTSIADDASTRNGRGSVFGSYSALGGGGGGSSLSLARGAGSGAGDVSIATGGGSSGYDFGANGGNSCYTQAAAGGVVATGFNGGSGVWGWGGSGGGARGAAENGSCANQAGKPGIGFEDPITKIVYGFGGYGEGAIANSNGTLYPVNNGWGGSVAYNNPGATNGDGFSGAAGVVIVRWITKLVPTYTKPTNTYLNVGMTETFTTNVAQDSATAVLTRTFKWESTTPTANGAYTLIKQGTGAANASFSWVPSDTSTSGSGYLYRLTVTDSDTAGLFITDSSTAFAIINRALTVSGQGTIGKAINIGKNETFTITLGTPTYRASLSPLIPGISIDTSTAGLAVIKISETITVGTYFETLTVVDSVSASVVTPLTIKIVPPPSLNSFSEQVDSGTVLYLDAANSASLTPSTSSIWKDLSGRKLQANFPPAVMPTHDNGPTTCFAPSYSSQNQGILNFATNTCGYAPNVGAVNLTSPYTFQTWVKRNGSMGTSTINGDYTSIVATPWNIGSQLGLTLHWRHVLNSADYYLEAGVWGNPTWFSAQWATPIPVDTWVFVTVKFTGSEISISVNNQTPVTTSVTTAINSTSIDSGLIFGKRFSENTGYYFNGSLATFRLYNRILSSDEITQNYNATKSRFATSKLSQLSTSKKYGVLILDSFTATSGFDTKTVTLAVGDRAGIDWDTATVTNRLNLSVQESLTVGTYYDTITVTDSLGQSSYLPITFTVTKADTLTVTMGNSLTTVYNGRQPAAAPKASISGLVGVDTATVGTYYYSATCAQGGLCKIGDVGPGGGNVFYISETSINAADGVSSGGIYLEVAPRNWNGNSSGEAGTSFATSLTSVPGTSSAIGTGAENSRLLRTQLGDSATAATLALNKTFNGVSDWFVPSYDELTRAITVLAPLGLGSFSSYANLWSSTQNSSDSQRANNAWSSNPPVLNTLLKTDNYYLRPIRAFSPSVADTSTPIDVETYTARGAELSFQIGAESNYQAVIYETSTLKITQASQDKLTLNLYGAVAGSAFTLQIGGGSGTGAITETVTAGGSALNCRVSNKVLSSDTPATEQKTCNVLITKASSRNYKEETLTATVYFMVFVNNQPTNQVGSGATIALNGVTSFETSTVTPPGITGFSSLNISLSAGGTLRITGSGLTGTITVKFYRNKTVSATAADGTYIDIPISTIQSAGATTGRVAVITAAGEAVSDATLVINP